ncbi:hypothetical protein HAX54_029169, partial [Datura stramonium]|nr:hypothetical protein [Datura stramonium]
METDLGQNATQNKYSTTKVLHDIVSHGSGKVRNTEEEQSSTERNKEEESQEIREDDIVDKPKIKTAKRSKKTGVTETFFIPKRDVAAKHS